MNKFIFVYVCLCKCLSLALTLLLSLFSDPSLRFLTSQWIDDKHFKRIYFCIRMALLCDDAIPLVAHLFHIFASGFALLYCRLSTVLCVYVFFSLCFKCECGRTGLTENLVGWQAAGRRSFVLLEIFAVCHHCRHRLFYLLKYT